MLTLGMVGTPLQCMLWQLPHIALDGAVKLKTPLLARCICENINTITPLFQRAYPAGCWLISISLGNCRAWIKELVALYAWKGFFRAQAEGIELSEHARIAKMREVRCNHVIVGP